MRKVKKPLFAEIRYGHTFVLEAFGRAKEGEFFHCAFGGCRMEYFILLCRNDGARYKVGRTCCGKVGLELPSELAKVKLAKGEIRYLSEKKSTQKEVKAVPKETSKPEVKIMPGKLSKEEIRELIDELD